MYQFVKTQFLSICQLRLSQGRSWRIAGRTWEAQMRAAVAYHSAMMCHGKWWHYVACSNENAQRERELLLTSQNFLLNRLPSSVGHFQVSIARPALSAAGSSRSLHQAVFSGESEYRVDSASVGRV